MNPKKIVITGAPGTGKSSIIRALEASGYFCFHEVIRTMTFEAKKEGDPSTFVSNPLAFVADPFRFNQRILEGRIRDYTQAGTTRGNLTFYDRGIPDVLAYMDFFRQSYDREFTEACEQYRYDQVFLLPPWEDIYISDNERLESFEEALAIHEHLLGTYKRFGYTPVTVPEATIEERMTHILHELNRTNNA